MSNTSENRKMSALSLSEKCLLENWFDFKAVKSKASYLWMISDYFEQNRRTPLLSGEFASDKSKQSWCLKHTPRHPNIFLMLFLNNSYTINSKIYFRCKFSIGTSDKEIIKSELRCIRPPSEGLSHDCACYEVTVRKNIENYLSLPSGTLCISCEIEFSTDADDYFESASSQPNSNPLLFSVSEDFDTLLKSKIFADITFLVNDKEFQAHKLILAARSPVFKAMFHHLVKENVTNCVEIKDMETQVFEEMLSYIYTGKCENLNQFSRELLVVSDKYDLRGLKIMCEKAQFRRVNYENALSVLLLADLYHADRLKSNVIEFIVAASAKFISSEAWKTMARENPSLIAEICNAMSRRLTDFYTRY